MITGSFLHFFPVPRFLGMPTVGLDISDDAIRFVELRQDRGSYLLDRYDKKAIPSGVIQDGTIQDRQKLISAASEIRDNNNLKFVRVSLPEEKSYLYHTTAPFTDNDEEMRESLSFSIEENVPFSADEVVFDYDIITGSSVPESEEVNVVVSVLPTDVVQAYLDVITTSNLQPLSLMVESQAIAKSVIPKDSSKSYLAINIRKNNTAVYIVNNNVVHFTSTFMTQDADSASSLDKSSEKGEANKSDDYQRSEAEFVEKNGESVAKEVKKVLSYWSSHEVGSKDKNKIKKVILCGQHATSNYFKQTLARELQINIETANVWGNALSFNESIPEIPATEALGYAAAIGLALPENI